MSGVAQQTLFPAPASTGRLVCEFYVDGHPRPKGNLAARVVIVPGRQPFADLYEKTKGISHWLKAIRGCAHAAMRGAPPVACHVRLDAWFYFARPEAHYTTTRGLSAEGRRRPLPRGSAQGGPIGDLDKLLRAVCDALQTTKSQDPIVFLNDDQVAEAHVYREWGDREGVRIIVSEMPL